MSVITNAWGDVGTALYDVPDTELAALAARLRELAAAEPGRTSQVLTAFAAMVDTERSWRDRNLGRPAVQRPKARRR